MIIPQLMDLVEFREVIEPEQTVREPDNQQVGGRMEGSAVDLGIVLHEEVLLNNPPASLRDIIHRFRVLLGHIFPSEQGSVRADCVDLFAISLSSITPARRLTDS